ncbi:TPA: hypothetical protein ACOEBN_000368 [Stenotrophomonas maltophilia]|uniref:hypothetical protein n=1 Tax=Stenotrophomonas TaxID=40323 RepID=UPI001CA7A45E|nr:hypothetical protein [Stenotrophomonas maltophilia]MBY8923592.1 hypothetical protein [Stenotrophomonas maltophilia]MCO7478372.1 hypothetical protein [Stenotrophomonas maltophilia]MCO7478384.1 hypothetical protein [Stenotrophomonas maltophilia]UVH75168.1 hypothetical protein NW343_11085 [Stenotrophomonas maltophilia]
MNAPKVTINSAVEIRYVTTKSGMQKQVHFQRATLESELMRVQVEVEVDGPEKGYAVGAVKEWDLVSDLVPGRYGIELARRMTLVDPAGAKPQPTTKAA